ncbi:MAG: arginase family protein, partial [Candidatus Marinimicrobia bacterium]|nr:arginase family protein [Candidatus Neomarinimicrobiota bacterium]
MAYRAPHTVPAEIDFPAPEENEGDTRLKHLVAPWNGNTADAVIIGMPFDHGVVLNHGRPGAAQGPTAIRRAMLRYGTTYDGDHQVDFRDLRVSDAGDVEIVDEDVPANHDRLTAALKVILEKSSVAVVFGGGHDATFASVRALATNPD